MIPGVRTKGARTELAAEPGRGRSTGTRADGVARVISYAAALRYDFSRLAGDSWLLKRPANAHQEDLTAVAWPGIHGLDVAVSGRGSPLRMALVH